MPTPMRTTRWRAADRPAAAATRLLVGRPEFERRAAGAGPLPPFGDQAGRVVGGGCAGELVAGGVGGEGPNPGTEARLGEFHQVSADGAEHLVFVDELGATGGQRRGGHAEAAGDIGGDDHAAGGVLDVGGGAQVVAHRWCHLPPSGDEQLLAQHGEPGG